MKKRFIEWDMPLAEISEEAAREKSIRHGHPTIIHIWWTKKPLASSRAMNFAALIDLPNDPIKRKELKELIKKITPWEAVKDGNSADIKKAQVMLQDQWDDNPPKILDPFAGGGSIPLEALRLGCQTYSSDLNPVAVFIEKAILEWPQKFVVMIDDPQKSHHQTLNGTAGKVNFLAYMVKKWSKIVLEKVKAEIRQFYPEESDKSIPIGYLWTRTIPCQNPTCGAEIPLTTQFWLAKIKKKNQKLIAYKPIVNKDDQKIDFIIQRGGEIDFDPKNGTVAGANVKCLVCGQITKGKDTRNLAKEGRMGERLNVIVLSHSGRKGKEYRLADEKDVLIFQKAEKYLHEKIKNWRWLDDPLPTEEAPPEGHRSCSNAIYGMTTWDTFFNSRQKLALITFLDAIKGSYKKIKEDCLKSGIDKIGLNSDEAIKAIMGYLAIILDRYAVYNTNLGRWHVTRENVVGCFGRQAIGMVWNYAETNPFAESFSWMVQAEWVIKALESNFWNTKEKAIVTQSSATSLSFPDNYFDAVLTDPPYYDNVHYADLADFFYIWLKRSVGDLFPEIFITPLTPKSNEIITSKHRHSNIKKAKEFFEHSLTDAFKEIYRVLKPGGIAVIIYGHKTTSGWETMLNSLVDAGLVVTASWPIHTEMQARLFAAGTASLASTIYMVCRKLPREKVGFFNELQLLAEERISSKLQQFWDEGIAGGDFFVSAIGPAMEIFSKYTRVEKYSGEIVSVAELLDEIRSISANFIVNKLLQDAASAKIDKESQFYLTYRWTYLDNAVEFDDARKLASASGINIEELWVKDGFVKKSGSKISVLDSKQRKDIKEIRNIVDVMHQAVRLWEEGKQDEINELITGSGYKTNPAFWQFCQAVAECHLIGNKEKQLLEGFLLGKEKYMRGERKDKGQKGMDQFLGA